MSPLTHQERTEFFSPSITPERRAELWMDQAELGEQLVNQYAWATPNPTAIRILKEFSPLVELGCGANAYWSRLCQQNGIDGVGYDLELDEQGGKINSGKKKHKKQKKQPPQLPSFLKHGGPSVLSTDPECANRTLLLCYPDEEDLERPEDYDNPDETVSSMGAQCLAHFQGQYVIHV